MCNVFQDVIVYFIIDYSRLRDGRVNVTIIGTKVVHFIEIIWEVLVIQEKVIILVENVTVLDILKEERDSS